MIAIRGRSRIGVELEGLLSNWETVVYINRNVCPPIDFDRYFFCQGLLSPKRLQDQTPEELALSNKVNYEYIAECCDIILDRNQHARICVIGSESGYSGSFDGQYALSKMCLHRYVEEKHLRYPRQQLVCVAPSIIEDSSMTLKRLDKENLNQLEMQHPKKRFLKSVEVAKLVYFCLYTDEGYLSNVVIRMHGGKHTI